MLNKSIFYSRIIPFATIFFLQVIFLFTGSIPTLVCAQQSPLVAPKAPIDQAPSGEFDDSVQQTPNVSPGQGPPGNRKPVYFPPRQPQRQASVPSVVANQGGPQYAFRPDLPNSEYGVCLNMEREWQNMYQMYYQQYNMARRINPYDPRYAPMTRRLYVMKQQLDNMWINFSNKCIYFPQSKTPSP